jgi:hypothetical protein
LPARFERRESVLYGTPFQDVVFREPAQDTLKGLSTHLARFTTSIAECLTDLMPQLDQFTWPDQKWALMERHEQALEADAFRGFEPERPAPQTHALYLHPREAKRLLTMQRLKEQREQQ